jgi:hypothetical protein
MSPSTLSTILTSVATRPEDPARLHALALPTGEDLEEMIKNQNKGLSEEESVQSCRCVLEFIWVFV